MRDWSSDVCSSDLMKLSIIYSVEIRKIKDNIYLHLPNYYLSLHPLIRNNIAMRKDIHPEDYRLVVFKDVSCDHTFMTRSTAPSKDTIKWTDGKEYPLVVMAWLGGCATIATDPRDLTSDL